MTCYQTLGVLQLRLHTLLSLVKLVQLIQKILDFCLEIIDGSLKPKHFRVVSTLDLSLLLSVIALYLRHTLLERCVQLSYVIFVFTL